MGKSPEDKARSAAKKATEIAMQKQEELYADLRSQQTAYADKYKEALRAIKEAPGPSMAQYIENARDAFVKGTNKVTDKYRSDLAGFQKKPRILNSRVDNILMNRLEDLSSKYQAGVEQMGLGGRDRLYNLPEQARVAFTASAESPAFNNLQNLNFMRYATGQVPGMTISNDANEMYRQQYTYNV